jgi:4-hydroxythreonine-4-phosphate dehydrogenase
MKTGIVFTIGDPNGIGAEIILKIFGSTNYFSEYNLKVVSPPGVLRFYADLLKLKNIPPSLIIDIPAPPGFKIQPGKINKLAGKIAGDAIVKAVYLCKNNLCSGLVTMPLSKISLNLAGYKFPGHTEFLMNLMNKKSNAMIMYHEKLICLPATTHIPLSKAAKLITRDLICEKIYYLNDFIKNLKKLRSPELAVLSLNPHSGENGKIGMEEIEIINPAVKYLLSKGFNIKGPFSPDGFFGRKMYQQFDGVLGMYHDQIMIPFKLISEGCGVNCTAGIDLIRTSPAHGTAFDIAGKNLADISGTAEALKLAVKLTGKKFRKNLKGNKN